MKHGRRFAFIDGENSGGNAPFVKSIPDPPVSAHSAIDSTRGKTKSSEWSVIQALVSLSFLLEDGTRGSNQATIQILDRLAGSTLEKIVDERKTNTVYHKRVCDMGERRVNDVLQFQNLFSSAPKRTSG